MYSHFKIAAPLQRGNSGDCTVRREIRAVHNLASAQIHVLDSAEESAEVGREMFNHLREIVCIAFAHGMDVNAVDEA